MKAVICGAGIAGLSLAQRLDTIGWDVMVIEKSPGPRSQGYMMDFLGSATTPPKLWEFCRGCRNSATESRKSATSTGPAGDARE